MHPKPRERIPSETTVSPRKQNESVYGLAADASFCPTAKTGYYPKCKDIKEFREEKQMEYCPNCKQERTGNGSFCTNCGARFEDAGKAQSYQEHSTGSENDMSFSSEAESGRRVPLNDGTAVLNNDAVALNNSQEMYGQQNDSNPYAPDNRQGNQYNQQASRYNQSGGQYGQNQTQQQPCYYNPPGQPVQYGVAQNSSEGLWMGILSIVLSVFFFPLGLVFGILGLSKAKRTHNSTLKVCSIIGTVISSVCVLLVMLSVLVSVFGAISQMNNRGTGSGLYDDTSAWRAYESNNAEYTPGTKTDRDYTNTALGLKFTLSDTMMMASDDEISTYFGGVDEKYLTMVEGKYEMMATDLSNGTTVIVMSLKNVGDKISETQCAKWALGEEEESGEVKTTITEVANVYFTEASGSTTTDDGIQYMTHALAKEHNGYLVTILIVSLPGEGYNRALNLFTELA